MRARALAPSGITVLLVTLSIYLLLLPRFMHTWRWTGDEPHYRAIVESIVYDLDLDLSNNYLLGPENPHVVVRPDGTWRSSHGIGLPLLMAVPYALGGVFGIYLALALNASLVAMNTYLFALETVRIRWVAVVAWLVAAFLAPGVLYPFQLYPELFGALFLLCSLRLLLRKPPSLARWTLAGVCGAYLPWLVLRFAPLSVLIGLIGLYVLVIGERKPGPLRVDGRMIIGLIGPMALSAIGYLMYMRVFYGSWSPMAPYDFMSPVTRSFQRFPALWLWFGWLFDQRTGLFVFAPIMVPAIAGMIVAWRERGMATKLGTIAIAWQLGFSALMGGFWIMWSVPTRYLITVLPLFATYAAYAVYKSQSRVFRLIAVAFALVSLANAVTVLRTQELGYPSTFSPSPLYEHYSSRIGLDLTSLLPQLADDWLHFKFRVPLEGPEPGFIRRGTYGFDVLRGEIIVDTTAGGDQAATITPLSGPGLWLEGLTHRPIPAGSIRVRTRARVDDVNANGTGEERLFTVQAYPPDSDSPVFEQDFSFSDFRRGAYSVHYVTFVNARREHLRFEVTYHAQAAVSLDAIGLLPERRYLGWDLVLLFAGLTAVYTALGVATAPSTQTDTSVLAPASTRRDWRWPCALAVVSIGLAFAAYAQTAPGHYEAEHLRRTTGRTELALGASWFRQVCGQPDRAGFVTFGPYDVRGPGRYKAIFRVQHMAPEGAEIGRIEVVDARRQVVLASQILSGAGESVLIEHDLHFEQSRSAELEFRVWYAGSHRLCVDRVLVHTLP